MIYQSQDLYYGALLVAVALFGLWQLGKAIYHTGFERGLVKGAMGALQQFTEEEIKAAAMRCRDRAMKAHRL